MRSVQQLVLAGVVLLLLVGWRSPPRLGLPEPPPSRVLDVPILLYHRVGARAIGLPGLTVTPAAFDAEVTWLHGAGFNTITQRQLYDALELHGRLPRRPVMLTFDDGYRDVLWNAAPILHRLRMHATMYVITSRVDGGDPSFLSWPELRRLRQLGFDIGSHTVHHVDLTAVSRLDAYTELWQSRVTLERRLHETVQWLAYPFGHADDRTAGLAATAGYVLAMTERSGSRQSAAEPLLLRRDEVLSTTGVAGVRALVESAAR